VIDLSSHAQPLETDKDFKISLITSSGHPKLRSDRTLASPEPDVAGYPYILWQICGDLGRPGHGP
jgi:hypothetical protein